VKTPNLVTIRTCASLIDAEVFKLRLECAGIFCCVANEYSSTLGYNGLGGTGRTVWLQVPEFEAVQARAILDLQPDDLSEIDDSILDAEAAASQICPTCMSAQIEYVADSGSGIVGVCRSCSHEWPL
jgi:hypothetical protein